MDKTIKIYRLINGIETIVAEVVNDKSTFYNVIMGKNEFVVEVVVESIINVTEGDYIHYNGIKYKLNRSPEFTDKSDVYHEHTIVFEHPFYTLMDKLLTNRITGSTKVVLTATLRDWAELIIWNVNKTADNPLGVDTGWTVGKVPDTEYKTIVFDAIKCRDAVTEVSSAYGVEYYFNDHELNFVERIENPRDFVFTQGKGKGLYEIEQANVDDGDVTTRLFPVGGTDNVIPGEGDEEGRLILPEKYLENFSESARVVEKKVVFDEIHPTFTGIVEAPYGDDNREFTCPTIDFNVQELAVGDEARVNFLTGDLLGKSFEFKWDDEAKKITLIYQEDDLAKIDPDTGKRPNIPSSDKFLRGGEKFNFTGIKLGESYKNAAIDKLREKGTQWLEYNCRKRVKFELSVDYRFMRGKGDLHPGDLITIKLPSRNIEKLIRINSVEKNLRTGKLTCVVSNYLDEKWKDKIEGKISSMQATLNGGDAGNGNVDILTQYDGRPLTDKRVFSSLRSMLEFVSKKKDDIVQGVLTFLKGISFGNFVKGSSGAGIYKDENGNWHIEGDYFHIRKKLTAEEVEIQRNSHIGGKLTNTPANGVCVEVVEHEDFYRCYFLKSDADGRTVYNDFRVNDQAYVETFNLQKQSDGTLGNHFLWRLVVGVDNDTEDKHYIDLSKTDCAEGSDVPQAGDDISQLGNRTDKTRQGAHVMSSIGGMPYYRIYNGIDSYTLPPPKIDLNPEESKICAKFISEATGEDIEKTINSLGVDVEAIRRQADKEFTMWYYAYEPTLSNLPASDWTDDMVKSEHVGDLFYNEDTGLGYTFSVGNGIYYWKDITDKQTVKALENAAKAQDTADGKRRTFVSQPTNDQTYDVGDLWVNATYEDADDSYENDTLVCRVAKNAGDAFSIAHWQPSSFATRANIVNTGKELILEVQGNVNEMADSLSSINMKVNGIDAVVKKINIDGTGKITNIDKSGLLLESDFASLFASAVDADGNIVKSADITAFITQDDVEGMISNISVSADQIDFTGKTIINGNFEVDLDGNLTLNNVTAKNITASGKITAGGGSKFGLLKVLSNGALEGANYIFENSIAPLLFTNTGSASYQSIIIDNIGKAASFLMYSSNSVTYTINLPNYTEVASKIGEGVSGIFEMKIIIPALVSTTSAINNSTFRITSKTNAQIYDNNGNATSYIDLAKGDVLELVGNIISGVLGSSDPRIDYYIKTLRT